MTSRELKRGTGHAVFILPDVLFTLYIECNPHACTTHMSSSLHQLTHTHMKPSRMNNRCFGLYFQKRDEQTLCLVQLVTSILGKKMTHALIKKKINRPPQIWGNICSFPHILGSPSSYMTLQLLHSEFPYI
jgi:hypothetical protein